MIFLWLLLLLALIKRTNFHQYVKFICQVQYSQIFSRYPQRKGNHNNYCAFMKPQHYYSINSLVLMALKYFIE